MEAINWQNTMEVDTSGYLKSGTWVAFGEGFDNIQEALNEVIEKYAWINGEGWGGSEVHGGQITFGLTGKRIYDDPAQDYIFGDGVKYKFGKYRKSQIRLKRCHPDTGEVVATITVGCTFTKISDALGKPQEGSNIAVDVDCNGKPDITLGFAVNGFLTVVSVVGTTTAGNSTVYINPALSASSGFVYRLSDIMPAYNEVCAAGSNGWVALTANTANNVANAVTRGVITVVEKLTSGNYARKVGQAILTAYSA